MSASGNPGEEQKQPPPPPPRPSKGSPIDGGPEKDPQPSTPSDGSGDSQSPQAGGQVPSEGSGQPASPTGSAQETSPLVPNPSGPSYSATEESPLERAGVYQPVNLMTHKEENHPVLTGRMFNSEMIYHLVILAFAISMVFMGAYYSDGNKCPLMIFYYVFHALVVCGGLILLHQVIFIWCRYCHCVNDHLLENQRLACMFQTCSILIYTFVVGVLGFEIIVLYEKYGGVNHDNTNSPFYCDKTFFLYIFCSSIFFLVLFTTNLVVLAYKCIDKDREEESLRKKEESRKERRKT